MKILTVGATPYLLVRNGRMNADVIRALKAQGHQVTSAVWHHDEGYYLPDDFGITHWEQDGENVCQLYPFIPTAKGADATLYEIMKRTQPNVVISMGDYKEVDFIYSIKAMYPNLFKWIAIFPFDSEPINENHKDRIEYADYAISTSEFGYNNLAKLCNVQAEYIPYGPDLGKFAYREKPRNEKPVYMASGQNSQVSNLAAFIKAFGQCPYGVEGRIHTNLYDPGDYDLELLIRRYKAENVKLPDYFCSVKDGPSDEEMAGMYASADFFVEASVKSATALTMLEAMAMGCIPIGIKSGRVGEIINLMPSEYRFFADFELFTGAHEEDLAVVSAKSLIQKVYQAKKEVFENPTNYQEASLAARKVAQRFSNDHFLGSLIAAVDRVSADKSSIAVESF